MKKHLFIATLFSFILLGCNDDDARFLTNKSLLVARAYNDKGDNIEYIYDDQERLVSIIGNDYSRTYSYTDDQVFDEIIFVHADMTPDTTRRNYKIQNGFVSQYESISSDSDTTMVIYKRNADSQIVQEFHYNNIGIKYLTINHEYDNRGNQIKNTVAYENSLTYTNLIEYDESIANSLRFGLGIFGPYSPNAISKQIFNATNNPNTSTEFSYILDEKMRIVERKSIHYDDTNEPDTTTWAYEYNY